MRTIIIPPVSLYAVEVDVTWSLDFVQDQCGGNVTVVHLPKPGIDMWLPDDGAGHEPNGMAWCLIQKGFTLNYPEVVGPAVLTGGADRYGETEALDEGQTQWVQDTMTRMRELVMAVRP